MTYIIKYNIGDKSYEEEFDSKKQAEICFKELLNTKTFNVTEMECVYKPS